MGHGGHICLKSGYRFTVAGFFFKVCFLDPLVDIGGDKGPTFK